MNELAKKRPNDPVNKFKLEHVNEILQKVNDILGAAYRPFKNFDLFDVEASLPTTSDVVMMLNQYVGRMDKFKAAHTIYIYDENLPGMKIVKESRWNTAD